MKKQKKEELDKEQVKEDLDYLAGLLREASLKIQQAYIRINEIWMEIK